MATTIAIAAGFVGFALGCVLGLVMGTTHIEDEVEKAYLYGHVDGYRKASDDAGEVPL